MNVKLLSTCNDPELLPAAILVFDTIRIGFPTAHIHVFGNNGFRPEVAFDQFTECNYLHHQWIEMLVESEQSPFYICDTDVIFWQDFESHRFKRPLAGRLLPQYFDRFTKANTMPRFHTSLMYIDPVSVRRELEAVTQWIRPTRFNPVVNPYYPLQIPALNGDIFYDTCSLLFHAIGGQAFTELHLDCYDHLSAATWIKELAVAYPEFNWPERHKEFYKDPKSAKGVWRQQQAFYEAFHPTNLR